ncbi:MAG: hypothetical protein LAP38_16595 [Acidobacteriia bacterium]|nr:hypothetical protein [Terriglobia bacterium]
MACPYFYPVARFETSTWVVPPRLPLGDAYAGECRAAAGAYQPDETRLRETCNVGYGRLCCDRFPEQASVDAVRFHVAQDAGDLIRIQYVFEKDCWPQQHGVLECSAASREFSGGPLDAVLSRQAAAFVESYLRRRD